MYGMYVRKNKIPPAAAPEFAEIIKYWYFVIFSKITCGKNMRATLQNNKKAKSTFTRQLLHRNRPLT
jgi:hypothetical protein